jgi:hypothetical protein
MTVILDSGQRAADQRGMEMDLSQLMTSRRRCRDLVSQRNGIDCRTLGDKSYRHPEYDKDFYQAGGLAVGSSFVRGDFEKTTARNNPALAMPPREVRVPCQTYAEKEAMRAAQEVSELTESWEGTVLREYYDRRLEGAPRRPSPRKSKAARGTTTDAPASLPKTGAAGGKGKAGNAQATAKDGVAAMWDFEDTVEIWEELEEDSDDEDV